MGFRVGGGMSAIGLPLSTTVVDCPRGMSITKLQKSHLSIDHISKRKGRDRQTDRQTDGQTEDGRKGVREGERNTQTLTHNQSINQSIK